MFFRRKRASGRDYIQIVENRWEGGQGARQRVIASLGRLDALRESGRLAAFLKSGSRLLDGVLVVLPDAEPLPVQRASIDVLNARCEAADALRPWEQTLCRAGASRDVLEGLTSALERVLSGRGPTLVDALAPDQRVVDALSWLGRVLETGASFELTDQGFGPSVEVRMPARDSHEWPASLVSRWWDDGPCFSFSSVRSTRRASRLEGSSAIETTYAQLVTRPLLGQRTCLSAATVHLLAMSHQRASGADLDTPQHAPAELSVEVDGFTFRFAPVSTSARRPQDHQPLPEEGATSS